MPEFQTMRLPLKHDVLAPDGLEVRILLGLAGGTMAHFALAPGLVSRAVAHRTVEEIWYFLTGRGEIWRSMGGVEDLTQLEPGVCISIPLGTSFQLRTVGEETLTAVAITMPPWPGEEEAYVVEGKWPPRLEQ